MVRKLDLGNKILLRKRKDEEKEGEADPAPSAVCRDAVMSQPRTGVLGDARRRCTEKTDNLEWWLRG